MERVIGGLDSLQHCRNASPDKDKYCIHFPFIIDMSSTKAVLQLRVCTKERA